MDLSFKTHIEHAQTRRQYLHNQLKQDIPKLVKMALEEDLGGALDMTQDRSAQLIPAQQTAHARLITRENGIFCGRAFAEAVFTQLGENIEITWLVKDGDSIHANQILCELKGNARILLTAERTAMNFIQTLSGCATQTALYVAALKGGKTRLLDTRKTIPGLRTALKYAVSCGGGMNHRMGVFDAYLIKENHIVACGGIQQAVDMAKIQTPHLGIEVEVENLTELEQAIQAGAHMVMLDNFDFKMMHEAVAINQGRVALEASGNVTLETLSAIQATGVDFVSVGAITKHLKALDLSMRFQ